MSLKTMRQVFFFKTAGNGKLHTSLKIHTDAGGDAELFKAWSDAQDNPH